jgi:uncharacterized tellurite resistance protein B-like protein
MNKQTRASLVRLAAVTMWADERIDPAESASVRQMARALGIGWRAFELDLKQEIDALMSDLDRAGESLSEAIGQVYLEDGVDPVDILGFLVAIVVADKKVTFRELEVIHGVAEVLRVSPVLVTHAVVVAQNEAAN